MGLLTFFLFSIYFFSIEAAGPIVVDFTDGVPVQLNSVKGEQYNLKLTRAAEDVLHPNVKVFSLRHIDENGQLSFDSWSPSNEELQAAQDVYIDEENLAAVRFNRDASGDHEMEGVVDGRRIEKSIDGRTVLSERSNQNHSDYIDLGRTITPSINKNGPTDSEVEVAIVCDKEFGDLFQHNRQRILDYFAVYFWEMNLRYRTMPSLKMSFRITSITIIANTAGQPFIEEARASDGRAEFGRILDKFNRWIYDQMGRLPKFDISVAITSTQLEWGGGLAYYRAACWVDQGGRRHFGTGVWNDDGAWGSVGVGAHEVGHIVGAPHDDDPNFPGGCDDRGYIMSGGDENLGWYFSTCSDRVIGEYVRSNEGSCLRRIDEQGSLTISPDYSNPLAPNMEEQCKRRLRNPQAFMQEEDKSNCKVMKCWEPKEGYWLIWSMSPVDNSICGNNGERCFRGRCRKQGSLFMNVGSGQCMKDTDPFNHMIWVSMADCVRPGTPLDRFTITDEDNGKKLATPWNTKDAKEQGDKCLWTGSGEGDALWTDRCDSANDWHGFNFIDVGNSEFLLQHRVTQRCAKQTDSYVTHHERCDRNDRAFRWKLQ